MTTLLLGPLLRHVSTDSATVWVETDAACAVTCRTASATASADTFEVAGHHYALVVLTGLTPDTSETYEIRLDEDPVWPEPGSELPASRIRTLSTSDDRPFRMVFGSCRKPREEGALGPDALIAYAKRMATRPPEQWPESLLLLGDQVYADETTEQTQSWLATRRDLSQPPGTEVADFEEYVHLYYEAWQNPMMRWLLSAVPTSMIFDDHDVRDDWNTSQAWREEVARTAWWPERIRGALVSYWIYQHLGNLGPEELAQDRMFAEVTSSGVDNAEALRAFADHADAEVDGAKGTRWSYRRDFGPIRLLVLDSRAGRILAGGARSMIGEAEFDWVERNCEGEFTHLLIGSSLPWLLPNALSHVQSINELACRRPGRRGRLGEWIRQTADLEHWPAFRSSFARLAELIRTVADREDGPATVAVLSGDVHHAYVAAASYPRTPRAPVYQLTCSPVHNTVPWYMRLVFRAGWWAPAAAVTRWWARQAGVELLPVEWSRVGGPYFGNAVATVETRGDHAVTIMEQSGESGLTALAPVRLSGNNSG